MSRGTQNVMGMSSHISSFVFQYDCQMAGEPLFTACFRPDVLEDLFLRLSIWRFQPTKS